MDSDSLCDILMWISRFISGRIALRVFFKALLAGAGKEFEMSRRVFFGLFALGFAAVLAFAGYAQGAEKKEMKDGVFFVEPKDGAQVKSPVKVAMGVAGMTIKPSGGVVKGTGHHHIIINGGSMRKGKVIPTDAMHPHYGKGQTEASLKLAPGDYTLTMQFADGLHRSYGKKWSATISIKVMP